MRLIQLSVFSPKECQEGITGHSESSVPCHFLSAYTWDILSCTQRYDTWHPENRFLPRRGAKLSELCMGRLAALQDISHTDTPSLPGRGSELRSFGHLLTAAKHKQPAPEEGHNQYTIESIGFFSLILCKLGVWEEIWACWLKLYVLDQ